MVRGRWGNDQSSLMRLAVIHRFFPFFQPASQPRTLSIRNQNPKNQQQTCAFPHRFSHFFFPIIVPWHYNSTWLVAVNPLQRHPTPTLAFLSAFLSIPPSITSIYRPSLSSAYCPLPAYCSPEPVFLDLPCT